MTPVDRLRRTAAAAAEVGRLLRHPEAAASARLLARKLPSLARALKLIAMRDVERPLSIGSLIEHNARTHGSGAAILFEDRRISHRELHEASNRWANYLAARGVGKGDSVAVLIENRPEALIAIAGIVKLGAIAAAINTKQRGRVLQHSLTVSKARHLVVGEELWDAYGEVASAVPGLAPLWLRDHAGARAPAGTVDVEAAVAGASATTPAALADVRLKDPCFYVYTSGTTGLPKASIMSHNRWMKAVGAFGHAALALGPDDVLYLALPLYHNNALTVAWAATAGGAATLALRRRFSVSQFWDDVRRYHATAFVYIGELCRYLLNQPPRADDRDHPVRRICGNGLRPDIWRAFKERFGIDEVYEFYAASECNAAFLNLLNLDCTVGVCPAPFALVRYDVDRDEPVRDGAGHLQRVGRGEVGLLVTQVTPRYSYDGYTDAAASERKLLRNVFVDGDCWFNSGDLLRDQGFRHAQFVDRVGDTFRWKGENVSTNEVAEALNTFGQVAESTVYGVEVPGADGRCGMAALVLRCAPADFDVAGFGRHVRAALPSYAWPRFLRLSSELEVTGTFKQMKGELKRVAYDPARVAEPLFALPARHDDYVPLTADLFRTIAAGAVAF